MPANVVKTAKEEVAWEKAKVLAAKEGHAENWAYIMGIYKKLTETEDSFKSMFINSNKIDEGFTDIIFNDIITAVRELVDVKMAKEKLIDGGQTLLIKLKDTLDDAELEEFEEIFDGYYFDYNRQKHVLRVSKD